MFRRTIGRLACVAVVYFTYATVVAAQASCADEVELALAAIGAGSAEEMRNRLFSERIVVFDDAFRAQAVAALPASLRNHRITQGKLLRRIETIFNQVLQVCGRSGKLELFLYRDDLPSARLWRGCVVAISDGLAEPLYDDELAGILAHELGHSYFEDEMAEGRRTQGALAMRVVELKCDGVAILSLKLLGYDPAGYVRGLRRFRLISKGKGLSDGIFQSHPTLVGRMKFSERFIKSLR